MPLFRLNREKMRSLKKLFKSRDYPHCTIHRKLCIIGLGILLISTSMFINNSINSHPFRHIVYRQSVSLHSSRNAAYWDNITLHPSRYSGIIDGVTQLKYSVKLLPNLTRLINATNPKFPRTINAPYLIENPELCKSVKNLTVLVVVNTATDHFELRQAIRQTWTNDTYYSDLGTVRVLFLLGRAVSQSIQARIQKEFDQHKDLLQGDFIDTYYNLTHKGVMGFKWLKERCRNPKFILKVDDDFMVNMFIYLRSIQYAESLKTVNVYCDYKSEIIHKPKGNKWYVSEYQFKDTISYLKFCKGKFVSMTNDILPSLYVSASKTPFFHLDDVLLFGYVMQNIPGLTYQTLQAKDMQDNINAVMNWLKVRKDQCTYFVIQASSAKVMTNTWSTIVDYFKA